MKTMKFIVIALVCITAALFGSLRMGFGLDGYFYEVATSSEIDNQLSPPPIADAGADQSVKEGDYVTLDGTNSEDGFIVSYLWQQIQGTQININGDVTSSETFVAPNVDLGGETLIFQPLVIDNDNLYASDTVEIFVNSSTSPKAMPWVPLLLLVDDKPYLKGDYIASQFMDDKVNSGGYLLTNRMQLTFNEDGTGTGSTLSCSVGPSPTMDFTYSLSSNGELQVINGDDINNGRVSSDGSHFIIYDTDSSDNVIFTMLGIKTSTGMSNSILNGSYMTCEFEKDANVTIATHNDIYFYGDGNATGTIVLDSENRTGEFSFSYMVTDDGALIDDGANMGIVNLTGIRYLPWTQMDLIMT